MGDRLERKSLGARPCKTRPQRPNISPEAIAKAGTYIVTLKWEGEPFPESHRAHLVVGFKS